MSTEPRSHEQAISVDEALAWLAEILEEPNERVRPDTPRDSLPAWDSLGQLVLMSALDERFRIRLTPDELGSLSSIGDVLAVLDRNGRLAEK
jgi:acyl carrier protein